MLLALVMVPILGFVACTALVGGAISSSAAAPKPYKSDNPFTVAANRQALIS